MEYLFEIIRGPYAGITVIAAAVLVSLTAGFSGNINVKLSMAALNAASYIGCFYLYVRNFILYGPYSGFLTDLGIAGIILSGTVVFCGLNILFFLSLNRISGKNFVRAVILLSFSVVSVLLLVMADNAVLVVTSVIISVLSIFNLLASLETGNMHSREYLGKFGVRAALPAALLLFGFSVLAGSGGIKNISVYASTGDRGSPPVILSTCIFACALYLYFFLYPFQGIFLRFIRRTGFTSSAVLWFLYIPAGMVLVIKFSPFFDLFAGKVNLYGFLIIAILGSLNLMGAGLGAIKAASTRRILSMFLLFQLGTVLLMRSSVFMDTGPALPPAVYDVALLVVTLAAFLPLSLLASIMGRKNGDDSIFGAQGLIRRHPYPGICFCFLLIWWLAADVYIFMSKGMLQGKALSAPYVYWIILSAVFITAVLLMAANVIRIITLFFRKPLKADEVKRDGFPRVFYAYLTLFMLLAAFSLVLVAIGELGMGEDHIYIWGKTFYIFGNGN